MTGWIGVDLELSWAAGFFDGEGTIFVNHLRRVKHADRPGCPAYPVISVSASISHVRREPLDRFAAAINGRKPGGPYRQKDIRHSAYYRWDACGRPSVHRVLTLLWPYLSEPKKEQARRVWAELEASKRKKSPYLPPLPVAA